MSEEVIVKHRFLALEDFYLHHQEKAVDFLGWRLASAAWSLKDAGEELSDDQIKICRRLQEAIREKIGDRPAEWILEVEESHSVVDFGAWIEHVVKETGLPEEQKTGIPDLDFNFETQLVCGTQLEEMQRGSWVKAKLEKMMKPESFKPLDPLVFRLEHPLPDLINQLDRDLTLGVSGGMRHPYQCSAAVGALTLRLFAHDGKPEERIVLTRRSQRSKIENAVSLLFDEAKARQKALVDSIKEHQEGLRKIPEGWLSDEAYAKCVAWSEKRFAGDNGLVGSDLFEGDWLKTGMPQDVQRPVGSLSHDPGSFAQMAQIWREQKTKSAAPDCREFGKVAESAAESLSPKGKSALPSSRKNPKV